MMHADPAVAEEVMSNIKKESFKFWMEEKPVCFTGKTGLAKLYVDLLSSNHFCDLKQKQLAYHSVQKKKKKKKCTNFGRY